MKIEKVSSGNINTLAQPLRVHRPESSGFAGPTECSPVAWAFMRHICPGGSSQTGRATTGMASGHKLIMAQSFTCSSHSAITSWVGRAVLNTKPPLQSRPSWGVTWDFLQGHRQTQQAWLLLLLLQCPLARHCVSVLCGARMEISRRKFSQRA